MLKRTQHSILIPLAHIRLHLKPPCSTLRICNPALWWRRWQEGFGKGNRRLQQHDGALFWLQLVEGAEAKALYGLTLNYKPLEALVERLLRDTTLSGEQVSEVLEGAGLVPFPDPYVEGFHWDDHGRLIYPGMPDQQVCCPSDCSHLQVLQLIAGQYLLRHHHALRYGAFEGLC